MAWTLEPLDVTCLTNHWGKKYNHNCHNLNVLQWGSTWQLLKKTTTTLAADKNKWQQNAGNE